MENNNTNLENNVDSAVSATENLNVEDTKNEVATETKEKLFTQEELDKIIEKRLNRAMKKAEDEKLEAEKLAKMSEAERQKALFDKEKLQFEEERKQYQKEKMELEVIKQLSAKNLPTNFSKYLLTEDAETTLQNINKFEIEWQNAIDNAVNGKLKGNAPVGGTTTITTISKEEFNKMGFMQKQKFAEENPDQYKKLMGL